MARRKINSDIQIKLLLPVFMIAGALGLYWYASAEPKPIPAETAKITVPEGFNVYQVATALESAGIASREEFLKEAEDEEGFLFPDTYEFFKGSKPSLVAATMKENFEKKTFDLSIEAGAKKRSMREIIIMASILEEEAATEKDRKIISGILWKRLDAGMPLQVDATLTYATGKATYKLTTSDLNVDSPYNTYKFKGLPLGPISNPGVSSIDAALNPTPSNYWFYLADSAGKTYYSDTYEGHLLLKSRHIR